MKKSIRKFLSYSGSAPSPPPIDVDVREEYAKAFRTESYHQFWTRVLTLSRKDSATCIPKESTASDRLSSYRLFAQYLLDPDQPTAAQILSLAHNKPAQQCLLSNYFNETANASILCGHLLKDIDHTRVKYRALKTSLHDTELSTAEILTRITEFSTSVNPFAVSAISSSQVRDIQSGCSELLGQLEASRDKTRSKIRFINKLKYGSGILLVALTASLTVLVAVHSLALLVAAPALIAVSFELASTRKLERLSALLDAAAKGTYTLKRDLDTISRLVTRLNNELEHMCEMVKLWVARGEDWLKTSGEMARQLKKIDCSFSQQLDELEEHMYLCFMTINRARNLVVKEILDPGRPIFG